MKRAKAWPSGGPERSFAIPVLPVAPGMLRIGIETLSSGSMSLLTRRASWSAPPPGPQGTMNSTGRLGYACEKAMRGASAMADPASNRERRVARRRSGWLMGSPRGLLVDSSGNHAMRAGDWWRRDGDHAHEPAAGAPVRRRRDRRGDLRGHRIRLRG